MQWYFKLMGTINELISRKLTDVASPSPSRYGYSPCLVR
jgi:hypothetical protein